MKTKPTYQDLEKENRILKKQLQDSLKGEYASLIEEYQTQNEELSIAKEKAEESEKKYTTLFNSASTGILIANTKDMQLSFANPAICNMLGYTQDELTKMSVTDIHPKDSLDLVISEFQAQARKEKTLATNLPCLRKDGSIIYTNINTTSFIINDTEYNVGFFTDISEKRESDLKLKNQNKELLKAKEAAEKNEQEYKNIFENSLTSIYTFNEKKEFLDTNRAGIQLLGYSKKELLKMKISDVDANTEIVLPAHDNLLKGDNLENFEHQLVRKDGKIITVLNNSISLKDKNGNVFGMQSFLFDITDRKKAEQDLITSIEKVKENENNLRALFNTMTDNVFEVDYNGKYLNVAPTSSKHLFISPKDTIGKTIHDLFPKSQADLFLKFVRKCLDNNEAGTIEYSIIIEEKTVWFEGRATPKTKNTILFIARDITEQKEAESELKKSEQKYQNIIENLTDIYYRADKDGKMVIASPSCLETFGYSSMDEIIGASINVLYPEVETRAKFIELLTKNGEVKNFRTILLKKDNSEISVETTARIILDDNGNYNGVEGIVRDISDRKKAERFFQKTVNSLSEPLHIIDKDFNIIFVNNAFINLLKKLKLPHDLIGKKIHKAFDFNFKKATQEYEQVFATGKAIKTQGVTKIGENNIYTITTKTPIIEDGKVDKIITSLIDITKQIENEQSILESEEKLKTIIDNASDAIVLHDFEGKVSMINKEMHQRLGYTYDEFLQLAPEKIDNSSNFSKKIKDLMTYGYILFETGHIKKDGKIIPTEVNARLVELGGHKLILSISRDITERKKHETKLIEQNKELIIAKEKAEESNRLKTEFINNMSHEIRTPMNGILGFAQLLSEPDITKEKIDSYVKIIQNSGKQLMQVIEDILEISKLGTKQVKAVHSKICINNITAELFSIFDIKAKENKTPLYLKKGLSDTESTIWTDRFRLITILSNLLENALKFTNEGFVEFGYFKNGNFIEFYVKDTGIGIRPEKQEEIFERFSQEEKSISQLVGGLGLGLSIAKENAKLINGEIWLKSEKGKGSTFYLSIPYKTKP